MRTLINKVINLLDVRKALRKAGRLIPTLGHIAENAIADAQSQSSNAA
jgi:hypothetical protein